jgi:DNA-binding transcriptional LysR family regulator
LLAIKFRHLATLVVLAEEASFNRAAQRLGFVQSAVSQQIAALERAVGQRLLERSRGPGRVRLTAAGEELCERAYGILWELAGIRGTIERRARSAGQILRIGVESGAHLPLGFRAASSALALSGVQIDEDRMRIERVVDDSLHFAVVDARIGLGALGRRMLLADRYVLLVLSRGDSPSIRVKGPEDLLDLELLAGADRIVPGAGVVCLVRGELGYRVAVDRVASDGGAAVVPGMFAEAGGTAVNAIPLDGVLAPRVLALCWRPDRSAAQHAGVVASAIRDGWLRRRARPPV